MHPPHPGLIDTNLIFTKSESFYISFIYDSQVDSSTFTSVQKSIYIPSIDQNKPKSFNILWWMFLNEKSLKQ